ncbi:MAG: hypothetical protein QOH14_1178 [Pseudonocardiales bacterium]|nr:hypothetical protein [Pseudonocardiales bacterium]
MRLFALCIALGLILTARGSGAALAPTVGGAGPVTSASGLPNTAATTTAVGSRQVYYRGVGLTVPAAWPVIDGAHARHTCSSVFAGQADRVFVGVSYQLVPSCAYSPGPFQKADGVWLQTQPERPTDEPPTTLPGGQVIYQSTRARSEVVDVWYHGVSIELGIGTDATIEHAILDSISYDTTAPDTALRGQCPAPDPAPTPMPTPVRITSTLTLDQGQAQLVPEPTSVTPKVSAAAVWANYLHDWGGGSSAPIVWHLYFGGYSSLTPATINPDGSTTPENRGGPTWLVYGEGAMTSEGPCGPTITTAFNANTGRSVGGLEVSG